MPKTPSLASSMNGSAHELRPADDEHELRFELPDRGQRLVSVDVTCLVQHGAEASRDLVEGALARAIRVDRPRQGDHADDLGARSRGRLEAVAADRVEAHPDRAHRRAMLPRY